MGEVQSAADAASALIQVILHDNRPHDTEQLRRLIAAAGVSHEAASAALLQAEAGGLLNRYMVVVEPERLAEVIARPDVVDKRLRNRPDVPL